MRPFLYVIDREFIQEHSGVCVVYEGLTMHDDREPGTLRVRARTASGFAQEFIELEAKNQILSKVMFF